MHFLLVQSTGDVKCADSKSGTDYQFAFTRSLGKSVMGFPLLNQRALCGQLLFALLHDSHHRG